MKKIVLPEYDSIPSVGLYLDQVNRYINDVTENGLTPTMITNYVKLKIVPKGVKKMYSKEQIAMFIMISYSKSILSMDQIKTIFEHYQVIEKTQNVYELFKSGIEGKNIKDETIATLTTNILNKIKLDEAISKL